MAAAAAATTAAAAAAAAAAARNAAADSGAPQIDAAAAAAAAAEAPAEDAAAAEAEAAVAGTAASAAAGGAWWEADSAQKNQLLRQGCGHAAFEGVPSTSPGRSGVSGGAEVRHQRDAAFSRQRRDGGCRPGTDIPFTGVKLDHARAKEIPVIDEAALYKLIISKSDGSATVFPALAPTAAPAATAFFAGADLAARDRNLADLSQELEPEKLPVSEIREIIENREALNDAEGEKGVGPDWVAEYDEKGVEPDWVAEEYEMWRAEQAAAAQMPLREPPPAAELAELAESDARDELGDAETNHVFPSGAVFPGRQALPEGTEDTNPHPSSPSSIRTDLKSE